MSSLGGLFNKAREAKATADSTPTPTPPPPSSGSASGFKIGGATSRSASAKQAPTPAPSSPKKIGGFKLGGGGSLSSAKSEPSQESVEPLPLTDSAPATPAPAAAPAPKETVHYPDETPAAAPQREIPEDVSAEVARFIENLDHLHTLTPEPELASAAIRNIMVELKSQPQYIKHVSPDDVRVMIQMMRETMGLAKAVKEKKASSRGKSKAASAEVQAAMAEFADLDGLAGI